MKTSIEETVEKLERLYENIFNLLSGFQQASKASVSDIQVPIKQEDGSIENVTINSFQQLQQELTRIDNNFKSLINADNLSYELQSDGSIAMHQRTTFMNSEYLEKFDYNGNNCIVDTRSLVNDLIFPTVKLPITINSKIVSDIFCKTLLISEGWEELEDNLNPTYLDLQYAQRNGKIKYSEIDRTLSLQKQQVQYFGKFNVEEVINTTGNKYTIKLNTINYKGLNNIGSSIELRVNDFIVSKTGSSKYQINSIDRISNIIELTRIAGSELIGVGIDELMFNEKLPTEENIVGVPIAPNQKLVIFLSTESNKSISYPSPGIKIDTESYNVVYNNSNYSIDEFFTLFVTDFSEYLLSFVNETSIPINLGVKPETPSIDDANIKVVQINKHLTDAKSTKQIGDLNKQKQRINNELEYKQKLINQTQNELDTAKFDSLAEKNNKIAEISKYNNDISILRQNLLSVSREIDTNATESGLKGSKPKYRAIAFWSIQPPIMSPLTKPQNIIKYDVQYRYLSKDSDTMENTSYKMVDNGKEVTVVFSPWNDLATKTLNKVEDEDGNVTWEVTVVDSVEDNNINQFAIPINESESLEVRIRAVSEAGYPIAPLKGPWSEIKRIDFPSNLRESNINTTINTNENDLRKAEFDGILQDRGVLSHISNRIQEAEKVFLHKAQDIASGQFTAEQKNIALDTLIKTMLNDISTLKNEKSANNVDISVIDFNNESYVVSNNSTMELSAGNYTDSINILDKTRWGSIIRKRAYIKIRNNNELPIELKSLVPGVNFGQANARNYYNVPVKTSEGQIQNPKQIIYFRNLDLTGQSEDIFKLVNERPTLTNTFPIPTDIDATAQQADQNVVYYDSATDTVKICKLNDVYSTNFIALTKEHPLFETIDNLDVLRDEFNRLKLYTNYLKTNQVQSEIDITKVPETETLGVGFDDKDFYNIGENSCGAFLYPILPNPNSISVVGDTTIATLIVPGQTEILIPFMFEYRMIDRFGNINGEREYDANSGLVYSKKIGVDMLINNETFKFDINVTSRLKSKVTPIESLNVSSVIAGYTNDGKASVN